MIELIQYQKQYGKKVIYHPIDLVIPEHSISFLMGKNGCGKTTLLKCIAGLESYRGEILFNGKPLSTVREECFVVWDDSPCYPNLTGLQNLYVLCEKRSSKAKIQQVAEKYLEYAVLKRKVKSYSYGQRKKLMLALVDLLEPTYLVMDEISNGLDIDMMDELANHLMELKSRCTILLTGHQFSFYEKIAEHIFLKKSETVVYISPEKRATKSLEELYHDKTIES
ncbi:MAG: ABC transporter ATP-binding protein [Oscillospiraceae bacterium]|nr:ABC transporter ATP-binding protein [Oscillospiraceae bacterium]